MINADLKDFYENWSRQEKKQPHREVILKWKAVNMANLIFRTLTGKKVNSICEVGGAEGVITHTLGNLLHAERKVNYDISNEFCILGKTRYPDVEFINSEFDLENNVGEAFDLIVLSDITEHVTNEALFLDTIRQRCNYVILKMPIEKCIRNSHISFLLRGRLKPASLRFGLKHHNRHFRGYTINSALKRTSVFFKIIDSQAMDITHFYPSRKSLFIKKLFGSKPTIWIFGGALFILGVSKSNDEVE